MAKFGNILRKYTEDLELLSFEIISNLVKFLNADVGGIYIYTENKKLKLTASYAYNEKKVIENEIKEGEGLIGTCAVEKTSFYFDKMPEDEIKITSGFGKTTPSTLLIVPLVLSGGIFGVIELASLREFSEADIKFTETLGEEIASTLSYMRVNLKTASLLKEIQEKADDAQKKEVELTEEVRRLKQELKDKETKRSLFTSI